MDTSSLQEYDMNFDDIYNPPKFPGSTMIPGNVTSQQVVTQQLVVGSGYVNDLSQTWTDSEPDKFPSSKALYEACVRFGDELRKIDPNNNFFLDHTVVTLPLIDMHFGDTSKWEIFNWLPYDGKISYVANGADNYIRIPTEVIPAPGYYFLDIFVERLDSGTVYVYDYADNLITTFDKAGHFCVELYIANSDITTIRFVASGTIPDESVVIDTIGLHRIADRFRNYLLLKLSQHVGGGGGLDEEAIRQLVITIVNEQLTTIRNNIDQIRDDLEIHRTDKGNPHGITPDKIDAAHANHTHDPHDIGAATILELQEISDRITEHLAALNPHGITPPLINAAWSNHEHNDKYAQIDHNHNGVYTTPTESERIAEGVVAKYITGGDSGSAQDVIAGAMCLASAVEIGIPPSGTDETVITKPITFVSLPYILHDCDGDYDYYEGAAATNRETVSGHPIRFAFKTLLTESDRIANVAAFKESSSSGIFEPTLIEYEFHHTRTISGYVLRKDKTNAIQGYPTTWRVYVDDVLVDTQTNNSNWATLTSGTGTLERTFPTSLRCRKFAIVAVDAQRAADGLWGIGAILRFSDVTTGLSISNILTLNTTVGSALTVADIKNFNPGISDQNTPLYLFARAPLIEDSDENADIQPVSLFVSGIRPEFGAIQQGVPSLIDKFTTRNTSDKTNAVWGEISTTNEDPDHQIQNIYASDESYWQTTAGTTTATITHTFIEKHELIGYRIVFSKKQIASNTIPNKITLSVIHDIYDEATGNAVAQTSVILNNEEYLPKHINDDSNYLWINATLEPSFENVSSIILTLSGTKGQTKLQLCKFTPMLGGFFYNPYTGTASEDYVCPLGRLDYVFNPASGFSGFKHSCVALGKICNIPIDGMRIQPMKQIVHAVPNPYLTLDVDVELLVISLSDNMTPPSGQIVEITEDYIYVLTASPARYGIKVVRLW